MLFLWNAVLKKITGTPSLVILCQVIYHRQWGHWLSTVTPCTFWHTYVNVSPHKNDMENFNPFLLFGSTFHIIQLILNNFNLSYSRVKWANTSELLGASAKPQIQ